MTLLTIYTPTYKRPHALERCKASVAAQAPCQHLVIEDTVGLGVGGMFADIPNHYGEIKGSYVYVLSDDDWLVDPHFVRDLPKVLERHNQPDILMVKSTIGGAIYPTRWTMRPQLGMVTLSNWIVKKDVFCSVPYGHRYEGDFDFIDACYDRGLRVEWWDRIVTTALGWGRGEPE